MKVLRAKLMYFLTCLLAVACGGGGGGSGGIDGGSGGGPNDGGLSVDTTVGNCPGTLDDFLDTLDAPSGLITIPNRSGGCDYLVDRSEDFSRDVIIEAGVTFAMAPGTSLEFSGTNTTVEGTSNSPIRFLPSDEQQPWGNIYFPRDSTTIASAVFSGGGVDTGPYGGDPAMVYSNGEGSTIRDSVFINSVSVGLSLIDASAQLQIIEFSNNTFGANASNGLSIHPNYLSSLEVDTDYDGTGNPNGVGGILLTSSLVNDVHVKDVGTVYIVEPPRELEFSISLSLVDPGVTFVLPDDVDVEFSRTTINGTSGNPVRIEALPGSASGWGALSLIRGNTVRNLVLSNGGSQTSSAGASMSIDTRYDDVLENIDIQDSRSWGLICESQSNSERSIEVSGLVIASSVLGDVHPSCTLTELPVIVDVDRIDPSECANNLTRMADVVSSQTDFRLSQAVLNNSDELCDYYVYGDVAVTGTSGSVTITPGTRFLLARNASLTIGGSLIVPGIEGNPVIFQGEIPREGYWRGIGIAGDNSSLEYVTIESGGVQDRPALSLGNGSIGFGETGNASVSNIMISGSGGDGLVVSDRVRLDVFSNNAVVGNAGFGVVVPVDAIGALDSGNMYDSSLAPNGNPGIRIQSDSLIDFNRDGGTYVFNDIGAPWSLPSVRLSDSFINGGAHFIMNAGVSVLFDEDAALLVGRFTNGGDPANWASLTIAGTTENPVRISGPAANPSSWLGLQVYSGFLTANNVEITGGGTTPDDPAEEVTSGGSLVLGDDSIVELSDVTLKGSRGWGIGCVQSGPESIQSSGITYADNALGNLDPECAF